MALSGNLDIKVPKVSTFFSSQEHESYPITSFDGNAINFEFQTGWIYEVKLKQNYLILKLKFVHGRFYETYNGRDDKRELKEETEEAKAEAEAEDKGEEEGTPNPVVTQVRNYFHSCF